MRIKTYTMNILKLQGHIMYYITFILFFTLLQSNGNNRNHVYLLLQNDVREQVIREIATNTSINVCKHFTCPTC